MNTSKLTLKQDLECRATLLLYGLVIAVFGLIAPLRCWEWMKER